VVGWAVLDDGSYLVYSVVALNGKLFCVSPGGPQALDFIPDDERIEITLDVWFCGVVCDKQTIRQEQ
jgi:hypothetical protein